MINIMCRNSYFKEESVIMAFIDTIYARAKADKKTIVLPESMDKRTFAAAEKILKEGIANLIIIGTPEEIAENSKGYDISGATIVDPFNDPNKQKYIDKFVELRARRVLHLRWLRNRWRRIICTMHALCVSAVMLMVQFQVPAIQQVTQSVQLFSY